jgi:hypothetical protein
LEIIMNKQSALLAIVFCGLTCLIVGICIGRGTRAAPARVAEAGLVQSQHEAPQSRPERESYAPVRVAESHPDDDAAERSPRVDTDHDAESVPANKVARKGDTRSVLERFDAANHRDYRALGEVVESATLSELPALIERTLAMANGYIRSRTLGTLMARWASLDLAGAAEFLAEQDEIHLFSYAFGSIATEWARADLTAAIAWVERMDVGRNQASASRALLTEWAKDDPEGALEYALAIPWANLRTSMVTTIFRGAMKDGGAASMDRLLTLMPEWMQVKVIAENVNEIVLADPDLAALAVDEMPKGSHRSAALKTLSDRLASTDLDKIVAWMRDLPSCKDQEIVFGQLAKNWVLRSPSEAANFVLGTPAGAVRNNMASVLVQHWAREDASAAMRWVAGNVDESAQPASYKRIAASMSAEDPAAALAMVMALPEQEPYKSTISSVLGSWMNLDPGGAMAWVEQMGDGAIKNNALYAMSSRAGREYPSEAVELALSITDPSTQKRAVGYVVSSWSQIDPAGVGDFLLTLNAGSLRDEAVTKFCDSIASSLPETAAAWAETIGSDKQREQTMQRVGQTWTQYDPDAASTWLSNEL